MKDITDDDNPRNCLINQKRPDTAWGPWETRVLESGTEWKRFDWRKRGGGSDGEEEERVLQWYKFNGLGKIWSDAQTYCEDIGFDVFACLFNRSFS